MGPGKWEKQKKKEKKKEKRVIVRGERVCVPNKI